MDLLNYLQLKFGLLKSCSKKPFPISSPCNSQGLTQTAIHRKS